MEGRGGDNLAHVEFGGRQTQEQLFMVPSSSDLHKLIRQTLNLRRAAHLCLFSALEGKLLKIMPCVADISRCYVFILLGYTSLVLPFSCPRESLELYMVLWRKVVYCSVLSRNCLFVPYLFNKKNAFRKGGEEMRGERREVARVG